MSIFGESLIERAIVDFNDIDVIAKQSWRLSMGKGTGVCLSAMPFLARRCAVLPSIVEIGRRLGSFSGRSSERLNCLDCFKIESA